jgi:hypothetical protein
MAGTSQPAFSHQINDNALKHGGRTFHESPRDGTFIAACMAMENPLLPVSIPDLITKSATKATHILHTDMGVSVEERDILRLGDTVPENGQFR